MASIYSTRFAAGSTAAAGPTTLYTVPSGVVAVIRTITLKAGPAATTAQVVIAGLASIATIAALGAEQTYVQNCRIVLNAGDVLELFVGAGTCDYSVSGYLLDN